MCLNPINLKMDMLSLWIIPPGLCTTAVCFHSPAAVKVQEETGHARWILWSPYSSSCKIQEGVDKMDSMLSFRGTCRGSRRQRNVNYRTTLWCPGQTSYQCISMGHMGWGEVGEHHVLMIANQREIPQRAPARCFMNWDSGSCGVQIPLRPSLSPVASPNIVNEHCHFLKLGDSCNSLLDFEVCEVSAHCPSFFALESVAVNTAVNQTDSREGNPLNAFHL